MYHACGGLWDNGAVRPRRAVDDRTSSLFYVSSVLEGASGRRPARPVLALRSVRVLFLIGRVRCNSVMSSAGQWRGAYRTLGPVPFALALPFRVGLSSRSTPADSPVIDD